jgi:hypothetical protein
MELTSLTVSSQIGQPAVNTSTLRFGVAIVRPPCPILQAFQNRTPVSRLFRLAHPDEVPERSNHRFNVSAFRFDFGQFGLRPLLDVAALGR